MVAPIQQSNSPDERPARSAGQLERVPARAPSHGSRAGTVGRGLTRLADRGTVPARSGRNGIKQSSLFKSREGTNGAKSSEALVGGPIAPMSPDLTTEMFVLARQTENRLLTLQRDVSECKSVDEAANFTRWLHASGVLALIERFTTGGNLPVNGPALRKLSETILSECGELYKDGKATPRYAASDIAAINHKLDLIAAHIAYERRIHPAEVEAQ